MTVRSKESGCIPDLTVSSTSNYKHIRERCPPIYCELSGGPQTTRDATNRLRIPENRSIVDPMMTDADRKMRSQIANGVRWAHEPDRTAATAPARRAFMSKFEREVDPTGVLSPQERAKRAECAKRAHYQRMALKSAQARRAK